MSFFGWIPRNGIFFCLSNNFVHKTKKQLDNGRNMIYNKIVIGIYAGWYFYFDNGFEIHQAQQK